ncbi:MAG: DUF1559 domain-containing protein [Planctomycetaceae bacterium]
MNGPLVRGKKFDFLACPSSPIEKLKDTGGGIVTQTAEYVGISGAVDDPVGTPNGFLNNLSTPQFAGGTCCANANFPNILNHIHARGGVLLVIKTINFRDITDGTSNTMAVSEQSAFAKSPAGQEIQINNNHGWMMGTDGNNVTHGARHFNLTTIRYSPNAVSEIGGTQLNGVGNNDGYNNGIFSSHEGGVQCALSDGSARFVSENVDLSTLKRVATRNDGQVVGEF